MADWKYELDIKEIAHDDNLSIQDKATAINEKIKETFPEEWFDETKQHNNDPDKFNELEEYHDPELCTILEWFSELKEYDNQSIVEDFDGIMDCLYDWANQEIEPLNQWPRNKMCWIKRMCLIRTF